MNKVKEKNYKNALHQKSRRGIKSDILNLRKKGKSYREIEAILKCSKSTIAYHCKNENLEGGMVEYTHHKEISAEDARKIYEFTKKNKNVSEASRVLGHCRTTILKYGCFDS